MMLRLALVGIVAALGVTLPSQTECDSWLIAIENWTGSFLADWDTWRPREHAVHRELGDAIEHECEQCRLARLDLARNDNPDAAANTIGSAPTPAPIAAANGVNRPDQPQEALPARPLSAPTITPERIAAGDDHDSGIAFDLDWDAPGIDVAVPPAPLAASEARSEWASLAQSVQPRLLSEKWGPLSESVCERWPEAVAALPHAIAEPAAVDSLVSTEAGSGKQPIVPSSPPGSWVDDSPLETSLNEPRGIYGPDLFEAVAFEMDQWRADERGASMNPVSTVPVVAPGPYVPIDVQSAASGIATEKVAVSVSANIDIPSMDAGGALPWPVFSVVESSAQPVPGIARETTVPWPVFAPTVAAAEPEAPIASNPSRASEVSDHARSSVSPPIATPLPIGLHSERLPAPSGPKSSCSTESSGERLASSPEPAWAQAVRLTQQAMCAWVDVLAGPTRVEVTAR